VEFLARSSFPISYSFFSVSVLILTLSTTVTTPFFQGFENFITQARNQGAAFGAFAPPKISKHCTAISTFAEAYKE